MIQPQGGSCCNSNCEDMFCKTNSESSTERDEIVTSLYEIMLNNFDSSDSVGAEIKFGETLHE
jgi:hypothetical protein